MHTRPIAFPDHLLKDSDGLCSGGRGARSDAGFIYCRGRLAERHVLRAAAVSCLSRSVSTCPANTEYLSALGDALRRSGRNSEALRCYRQALAVEPRDPGLYCGCGAILMSLGKFEEARHSYARAIISDQGCASAFGGLGDALDAMGECALALVFYERAVQLDPDEPDRYADLGFARLRCAQFGRALRVFSAGLLRQPRRDDLLVGAGDALLGLERTIGAADMFLRAVESAPHNSNACRRLLLTLSSLRRDSELAGAWLSLAGALESEDACEDAAQAFLEVVRRNPRSVAGLVGLGRMHLRRRDPLSAAACFEAALRIAPQDARAHLYLGWSHGLMGDLRRAWNEIAIFFRLGPRQRHFEEPTWTGEPLNGRTLLLWANAGLGDSIEMLRYLPLIDKSDGHVLVECPSGMTNLVGRIPGTSAAVMLGSPLPAFDLQAPLSLLPCIFCTTLDNMTGTSPYATVPPDAIASWRRHLALDSGVTNIGLVWSGEPRHPDSRDKSTSLTALSQFAGIRDVQFVSLQLGPAAAELLAPPSGLVIRPVITETASIDDTAAIIMNLDLIITVDTMVAHLAGALGQPVWTMLCYASDWRWRLEDERPQAYPSMRLFRQERPGDWESVARRVRLAIEARPKPLRSTFMQ